MNVGAPKLAVALALSYGALISVEKTKKHRQIDQFLEKLYPWNTSCGLNTSDYENLNYLAEKSVVLNR